MGSFAEGVIVIEPWSIPGILVGATVVSPAAGVVMLAIAVVAAGVVITAIVVLTLAVVAAVVVIAIAVVALAAAVVVEPTVAAGSAFDVEVLSPQAAKIKLTSNPIIIKNKKLFFIQINLPS
jgi:hypothetical protein